MSGNPIIILFENGAQLNAPYWSTNGAILCNGNNYITVDGGTNGIVQATQNGTSLANQQASQGLQFNNCSNIEVRNLTIKNIYQVSGSGTDNLGRNTSAINFGSGSDNLYIHNNSISYARAGIYIAYSTVTNVNVYGNSIDFVGWGIVVGDSNNNSSATGVNVYGNSVGPHFQAWADNAQTIHEDGIFFQAVNSGSTITGTVYNNYVHGDMCYAWGNCTGYLFLDGGQSNVKVFNNIISHDVTQTTGVGWKPTS